MSRAATAGRRRRVASLVLGILVPVGILAPIGSLPSVVGAPERRTPTHLTVIDEAGAPIPGVALVEASRDASGRFVVDPSSPALAVTDDRGVVRTLPTLARAGSAHGLVRAGRVAVVLPDLPDAVTVRLAPAGLVRGTMRDGRGRAVPGIPLVVIPAPREDAPSRGEPGDGEIAVRVVPDAQGAFEVAVAPPVPLVGFLLRRDGRHEGVGELTPGRAIVVTPGAEVTVRLIRTEGRAPAVGDAVRLLALDDPFGALEPERAGQGAVPGPGADEAPGVGPTTPGGRSGETEVPVLLVERPEPVRAVADEAGRVRFLDVPPGVYELALEDDAWAIEGAAARLDVSGATPRDLGTVFLERRGAIEGVVLEATTRAPIPDALVLVVPSGPAPSARARRVPAEPVRSDASGAFRFERILPGAGYRLAVRAPGFAPSVEVFDVRGGVVTSAGKQFLVRARSVVVTVVDPDGAPVEGAVVRVTPADRPDPDPSDPLGAWFTREGTTDASGVVAVAEAPAGDPILRVGRAGYIEARRRTTDPGAGGTRAERVEISRRGAIRGSVRFADRRVEGVLVRGRGRTTGEERTARVDDEGAFTLVDFGPEPVDVEAVAPGGGARDASLVLARRESVVVGSGELVVLDVPFLRRISGDVDELSGTAGAPRARLEALRYDPATDDLRWRVVSERALDPLGAHARFEFAGIPPGRFAVRVLEGSRDTGPVDVLVESGDVDGLSLRVPAAGTLAGRVTDATRRAPALGAVLTLVRLEGDGPAPAGESGVGVVVARDDGTYVFEDVAPGRWRIEAHDDGAASARVEVSLREGEPAIVPTLVLSAGGTLEGRISDESGRAVASIPVHVLRLPGDDLVDSERTGEDGGFRARALAAGRYRVVVEAGRGLSAGLEAEVEVEAERTTTVDLTAKGDAQIEGVVRRRGTPVPGLLVEAISEASRGADRFVLRTNADAFGRFRFPGLSEGRYRLVIVDGAVRGTTVVFLRAGDRVLRELEVGEGRITGIVRTARGEVVREAEVVAFPEAGRPFESEARVRTGPDGTFAIFGLPASRYRLLVTPTGRPTRVVDGVYAEPPGQERPVEVVVGRGGRLDLFLKDDRRRSVAGADVWVEDARGVALHPRAFRTGASGRAIVEGLPEGRLFLRLRAPGYGRVGPIPIDVRDGSTTPFEWMLKPAGGVLLTVTAGRDPKARARVDVLRGATSVAVDARRSLRRPDEPAAFGTTSRAGTLLLDDLEEGVYTLVVDGGRDFEVRRVPVRVRVGETEPVVVALAPSRR